MTREKAVEIISQVRVLMTMDGDKSPRALMAQESLDMAIKALEQEPKTNQEYIATLSPTEFWNKIRWLQKDYGARYLDSYTAIIEWLSAERSGEE